MRISTGSWKAEGGRIVGPEGTDLAGCFGSETGSAEDNAILMASVFDLLAAVEAMIGYLDDPSCPVGLDWEEVESLLRAAVATARGEDGANV